MTSLDFIKRDFMKSMFIQDSSKTVADLPYQWSDSEPGVDMVGIYVENHYSKNRECFIWIRFDNMKLGEKGCLPLRLEDPLISETCPVEESASHHDI